MNASFTFWFPTVWTLLGAVFTIFSFFLAAFLAFGRRDSIIPLLEQIVGLLRTLRELWECLKEVQMNVEALRTALAPQGESHAQVFRGLQQLLTDLQALASIARETCEATRSRKDPQAPAIPVLLQILTEVRKLTMGLRIQRRLPPFSLRYFVEARAEVLARERIQATPNPFPELD